MSKVTIYGKKSAVALETIDNVEEHYCTNGMFYVKAKGQEYYFALEVISVIRVETESEEDECKGCYYNDGEVHAECVICDKAESEDKE